MKRASAIVLGLGLLLRAAATGAGCAQWEMLETSYKSDKAYANAFTEVEVDVVFQQGEKRWKVPAFWAGGDTWKVRFAPPAQGTYTYHVECTDKTNAGLNGKEQTLQVAAYTGKNPLLQHGFLKVSADKRHFEHADGTPFFWLGDTWWKGLCKRLTWEGFQELTADRKAKGFSVVQLVCGTYPDEGLFQPGWENEGGKPYETPDYSVVNPNYFEYADRRIRHLVDNGILPVVVGGWGRGDCDGMAMAGLAGIKRHWRNLVARYGAYPTVWIIGGETGGAQWSEVTRYVHGLDPYDRPVTIHNPNNARTALTDENLLDFDMLETSHDDWAAAQLTLTRLNASYSSQGQKVMPVMIGEACYEGHMQRNWQDVQRHLFWSTMLSGSAGHTYGAAGIWHVGVDGDPGHVAGWFKEQAFDWTTWKEGMNYPGSTQLGLGKKLLEQYPWARFEPHPEWVEGGSFAAGIPGEVRFIFLPRRNVYNWSGPEVRNLEPDVDWHVYYFDPATGRKFDQGTMKATAKAGDKDAKPVSFKENVPSPQDWILVFERAKEPIQVHPDNPHYLLWRGKPTVLVTSGEHYGAVMNAPFDYVAYLDELQSVGLNLTRLFSGVYCEATGDFNIKDNTLAPGPGNLLCPYARSNTPGYANGGNKFDLTKWDEAYFTRLKDFVAQAGKRGIVVEFVLFCPYYAASQWNLSPFNAKNNVNGADLPPIDRGNGLTHPKLLEVQQAFVREVVTELKDADNLYYEVCNEAYGVPFEWQHKIANTIVETEKALSCKHMIAQNTSPVYDAVHPAVSVFNFHPGAVNADVRANYGLNKLTGLNETSPRGSPPGASTTALDYRRWGWTLLLDGGAIYNNLDYSFTVRHPKGACQQWDEQPGGGMAAMRQQLRILKDFMEGLDFVRMKPCQNGIALAPSAADDKTSRILIQWNEQAWESLNFPIKPDGTQGDSWHGDGLVLAKKIAGDEGQKTGAAAGQKGVDPATAAADVRNLIGRWDVVVNHSFKTVWTFHEDGTVESTAGGVRSARWKAAAKRTPTAASLCALAEPGQQYAIYLHGGKQASLTLDVPAGRYRAEWVNTLTGNVDKSAEVTHGGGALTLSSPDYTDDVALRVKVIKP